MTIIQFNGDETNLQDVLQQLEGQNIVSVNFSRWLDEFGVDKGGRIDVTIGTPPVLYAQDILVSSRDIKDDQAVL